MPGVIMENGSRNGLHTNHDRDQRPNGVNGGSQQLDKVPDKLKGRTEPQQNTTPISPNLPNGFNGAFGEPSSQHTSNGDAALPNTQARVHELPPEVIHITEGYLSLSELLARLAQKTFNDMTSTALELAQMPVPSSAVNGHGSPNATEDNSEDNLNKKLRLLKFLEGAHADWAKHLTITEWSRKAGEISRLIDLRQHLRLEKQVFNQSIDTLCQYKLGLLGARLPNPDLRTALEVLTTGKVSRMPDLGYIQPPPLSAAEILKTLETLNTLLSIRLNLHEHDTLPFHFQDYTISSGRVTFSVLGEFEVDLAIASEDPEAQFWFIDLRFVFWPKPADMDPTLRFHLEQKVNEVLFRDGLSGCYKYLHELVLSRKILEIRRQAAELARGKWTEGLVMEQLNRTLSIQYWVDRYSKGPKSWILLGVHSGKPDHGRYDPKATSRLSIRWFRDGKEVKDEDVTFDVVNLSAENLLKTIISRHVNSILISIRDKLESKPLFANQEASINLTTSSTEPDDSVLRVQLTHALNVSVRIEAVAGRFVFSPAFPRVAEFEHKLNLVSQDPANDAHTYLESLRHVLLQDEIQRNGTSVGWMRIGNPGLGSEVLKPIMPKDTVQIAWFIRQSWASNWYLAISFGMSGEKWWLIQGDDSQRDRKVVSTIQIPVKSVSPIPSYAFMSTLNVFIAALLSGHSNTKALHGQSVSSISRLSHRPSKGMVMPSIFARLSEIQPSKNKSPRTGKPWAKDIVRITFKGLEIAIVPQNPPSEGGVSQNTSTQTTQALVPASQQSLATRRAPATEESVIVVTEARMVVPLPKSITTINEMIDRDIAFHAPSGSFAFKLRSPVGGSVIDALKDRTSQVERLVDYVQVLRKYQSTLKCDSVSLGKISFSYTTLVSKAPLEPSGERYSATIDFGTANEIKLVMAEGDPHLRIMDMYVKLLNDPQHGFNSVARFLPVTLPALRGLDMIEAVWDLSTGKGTGECSVLVKTVDWYTIRYHLSQLHQPGSETPPREQKITFEMRMNKRKRKSYWHILRTGSRDRAQDDFDVALNPIWNAVGEAWLGMRISGVAEPSAVEKLLSRINTAIREVAWNPTALEPSPPTNVSVAGKTASRQQPTNQQKQQVNQRQNATQNQGRNNTQKRELIEID